MHLSVLLRKVDSMYGNHSLWPFRFLGVRQEIPLPSHGLAHRCIGATQLRIRSIIDNASLPGKVCSKALARETSAVFGARPFFQWHEKCFCCKLGSQFTCFEQSWHKKLLTGVRVCSTWAENVYAVCRAWCKKTQFFCCCLVDLCHLFIRSSSPMSPVTSQPWPCQVPGSLYHGRLLSSYFHGISGKWKRRI